MSERYTRVFALPENLYAEFSPVIISAGALLKDNVTGKVLVQLKIKNISDRIVKAVRIKINQFDVAGEAIDNEVNQEYLDLNVGRNSEFGQKTAITLPDSSTRSFSVVVTEVIFFDNDIWKADGAEWATVIKPQTAFEYFGDDNELLKQYKLDYNVTCKNMFAEDRDLWICSCGNVNKNTDSECYGCGCLYETFKNFNRDALENSKNERIEAEKQAEEERRLEAEKKMAEARQKAEAKIQERKRKTKKALKIISITVSVVALGVAIWFATINLFIPMAKYNEANSYFQNAEYDAAIAAFKELEDFSDSADRILEVKYAKACALSDNGNYKEAADLFLQISDYNDSGDKRYENLYNYVLALKKEEKYSDAVEICDLIVSRKGVYYKEVLKLKDECLLKAAKKAYAEKQYKSTIEYLSKMSNLDEKSELYQTSKFKYALENVKSKAYFTAFTTLKELDKDGYKKAKDEIYETGKSALKNKSFEDAVKMFEYLGNYKDSKSQLDATKYGYVKKYNDDDNETTYEYLKYLKKKNYKDSAKIYKELYAWKVDIVVNDRKDDDTTDMSSISKYRNWYFHVELSGGEPGAETQVKYIGYFPNGDTISGKWDSKWSDGWGGTCWFYYNTPVYGQQGTFKLKVFDGNGKMIGEHSVKITG